MEKPNKVNYQKAKEAIWQAFLSCRRCKKRNNCSMDDVKYCTSVKEHIYLSNNQFYQ